jgi:hypothetical protein
MPYTLYNLRTTLTGESPYGHVQPLMSGSHWWGSGRTWHDELIPEVRARFGLEPYSLFSRVRSKGYSAKLDFRLTELLDCAPDLV